MKRISLFIPDPAVEGLQELSKREDLSVSELIRQAIAAYLEGKRSATASKLHTQQ